MRGVFFAERRGSSAPQDDRLARIGRRAATLFERLSWPEVGPLADEAVVAATIERWARLYARGDIQALERRLQWDGIDDERLSRALAHRGLNLPAAWTSWLPRILAEARRCTEKTSAAGKLGMLPEPDISETPFAELWVPFVRVARVELSARAGARLELLQPTARIAFEAHLARGLAGVGELAVLEVFRRAEGSWWRSREGAYAGFMQSLLGGELLALFDEFPVLARQWAGLIEAWVTTLDEMLTRLERDQEALCRVFGVPALGRVSHAEPGLSDRHHGGRRVARLTFESGLQVLYKPRSPAIEVAWNDLLAWCAAEGLPDAPPTVRLLGRTDYGWAENVERATLTGDREVERYFRAAGALTALTYVMGARDLHGENVVAAADGPVLVDAEMLLAPRRSGEPGSAAAADETRFPETAVASESCLDTGLVTEVRIDEAGETFDVGGLQPSPRRETPLPARLWRNLRTSAIGFSRVSTVQPPLANQPVVDGRAVEPAGHGGALRAGFVAAYRFLTTCRAQLLAESGPLAAFRGTATRLLYRPSAQYGALLYATCTPAYQRDGIRRSLALDSLNRVFSSETRRPRLWPLTIQERDDLERLDIPRLAVTADESVIVSADGSRIEGMLVEDGLSAARRRLCRLGERDLTRQLVRIDDALASLAKSPPSSPVAGDDRTGEAVLVMAARELAGAMLARAERSADGLTWRALGDRLDLYGGAVGPALFLAALWATTRDPTYRQYASDALSFVRAALARSSWRSAALGACEGWGSVVYALGLAASLLHAREWTDWAVAAAKQITEERIFADRVLDVEAGSAGAILGLLALREVVDDEPWLLDTARRCGERLLATQRSTGTEAGGWPGIDGRVRAGYAHGCAGVVYALARLHAAAADERLLDAAHRAVRHEQEMYSVAAGNWPALGLGVGSQWMVAWCQGAPGIALARALTRQWLPERDVDDEIAAAIRTTRSARPHDHDHLCCGNMGRADVLLTVGRRLHRPEWVEDAEQLALRVAERVLRDGRLGARTRGYKARELDPSFFQGLSGVGYQLLRFADPERLPSVLAFDVRGAESR